MDGPTVCLAIVAVFCLIAALPLAITALVIAVRAGRRADELARRLGTMSRKEPPPRPVPSPIAPLAGVSTPAGVTPVPPILPRPAAAAREPAVPPAGIAREPLPDMVRRPAVPPRPPTAPPPAKKPFAWEELIGLKLLAVAGIVVVLIGAGLFVAYAHERGWLGRLGPQVRVALMILAGLGAMVAGEACSRKGYRALARVLTGGGLAFEYFAGYSAWARFHVIPEPAAWIFMTAVTAVAIVLAVRYASLAVAILSLVGGLAAPILIQPERDPGHVLFLYLLAVNGGVLVLAYFRKWRVLNLLALLGTIANIVVWLDAHYWHGGVATEKLPFVLTYMTLLWAAYFALAIVYHLLGRREASALDLPVTLINAVAYFLGIYVLLRVDHHALLGPAAALVGAVYLAEGLVVRRFTPGQAQFVLLQVAQALGLLTLAIPIQLDGVYIPMAWAVEAALLYGLGLRLGNWKLRGVAGLVHVASVGSLIYYAREAWDAGGPVVLNARTATFAVVALAMALSAWLYRRQEKRSDPETAAITVLAGAAHALLLVLIGVEVARWYETAAEALCNKDPAYSADPSQEWRALEWTRDAALAIGWAAYGLVAVGLAAVLRRALHHAMALVAFGASFFVLAMSVWRYDLPALESVAAWNVVGLTFAAVVACLAAAALVSHYTAAGIALGRAPAIAYELLAFAAVLGLYLTELLRASQYMEGHDIDCNEATWHALAAAGFAVVGGVLALRGLGVASLAHCVAGLAALAAGIVILLAMAVSGYEGYATPLWQPRGVAFILLIGALALVGIGCGRRGPVGSPERNVLAPVLAVVAHAMVLVLFTLEAEDFWASHIDQWFKDMPAHAWYARQATLSVGYALYAFGLLAAGIRRRQALLRILALVLLGGTLAKVMLLDLSKLEAIWRILSLGGLGLLLLAASLLYHKYRGIIFRTESAPKAEKEDPDAKA